MKHTTDELRQLLGPLQGRKIVTGDKEARTVIQSDNLGHVHVQSFENVDHILAKNAYLRGVPKEQKTKDGMRMMASIPLTLYHDLKRQGIMSDQKKFRQWLNDPSNSMWRVTEGKL